jgi:Alkaline phosphatase PhoX
MLRRFLLSAVAAPLCAQAFPLPASAPDTTSVENTTPFVIPMRMTETKVTDRNTMISLGLSSSQTQWDQIAFDPTSRYVCLTGEQTAMAALFRYDTLAHAAATLMIGNGTGVRSGDPATWNPANDDFSNLDPCLLTPWGTILTGEEANGGRAFEIMNPFAASGPFTVVWRSKIPSVTFEGMRFDSAGTLYFSDEDNSGSIYKFVPSTPGDLSAGQTFVLSVDAFLNDPRADPSRNWDSSVHIGVPRFGPAHWVPMTDAVGNPLTATNPFVFGGSVTGGRDAADELFGTPFGRCEDMDIGVLANGREVLYSSLTRENRILAIELVSATQAIARVFVDFDTINLATGLDVNPLQSDPYTLPGPGTTFNDPDNLAVDAFGNVYIVEDAEPGDIWRVVDSDHDGVAEAIGIFASLGVGGAEPSGLIFDPNDPYRCVCNILGPSSHNSAMWAFHTRPFPGSQVDFRLQTGVDSGANDFPGEFVKAIPGNHHAILSVQSPGGGLALSLFYLLIQGFPTVNAPVSLLPSVWLNPGQDIIVIGGGQPLPVSGSTTSVFVPPGLDGWSVMVQAAAYTNFGTLVLTDGHEYVLN